MPGAGPPLRGLAHLYVLCKGGDGEVGPDSFSLKRAQRESTSSEAKAPGRQRHESPPLPKTAKCQPPQSRSAGLGARAGAVAVEQLSELCFGRGGHGANQSVGRDKDKSPGVGSMSPHLYKERKGGPAPHPKDDVGPGVGRRSQEHILLHSHSATALSKTFTLERSTPPALGNPNTRTSRKPR